ncbi:MAG TPA: hypothetical protein VFD55_02875 [Candidatus Angelobacter sp.]|nr:hypothetical protein [Candidatus Angelobacter sp.]
MNCEKIGFGLYIMSVKENSEPYFAESLKVIEEIRELPDTKGFYNAAVFEVETKDGSGKIIHLLGRQVKTAGGEGKPDAGSLVLKTLGPDGNIASSKEVWRPNDEDNSVEDARALVSRHGVIDIGFTFVTREDGKITPRPAILKIRSVEELAEGLYNLKIIKFLGGTAIGRNFTDQKSLKGPLERMLPKLKVIKGIIGDETTPLGEEDIDISTGKNVTAISTDQYDQYVYRPEGKDNNHCLRVFEYRQDQDKVSHKQYLHFPNVPPWAEFKIGTTMPPVWLNKNEAFFPIHGIKMVDGKYVYSIGTARLLRDENGIFSVDNISQEPIIEPDLFNGMFKSDEIELHNERRVVYCCGGIPNYYDNGKPKNVKMFINRGDTQTFEVTVSMEKIIKSWQRS